MRALLAALAALALCVPLTASIAPAPGLSMQANPTDPLWSALRATGHTPAEWASLLTSDADQDGLTDFLDLTLATAAATRSLATPVELLVKGSPQALQTFVASHPDAVPIPAAGGVFVTLRLGNVGFLPSQGLQVVWEPRAYTLASTNPAGSSPSTMPQVSNHQGGAAWTAGYTGAGVKIAIIDTGADATHQALDSGKVVAFQDCVAGKTTAYDDHGHGTHVASIAAGDDGSDFRGIAYQASVVAIKVLDSAGSGTLAGFSCGASYVYSGGTAGAATADVASMSAGLGVPPLGLTTLNGGPLDLFGWDAVAETIPNHGIPFTVAAGNWIGTGVEVIGLGPSTPVGVNGVNQVSSPGFANKVVTVGAIDEVQVPATFSAIGPGKLTHQKPDVAAQGVLTWGALAGTTNQYEQWDGTSMATPLAAGTIALLMDKTSGLGHTAYENAIRNGADPACVLSTGSCWLSMMPDPNNVAGYGVVKASSSLSLV